MPMVSMEGLRQDILDEERQCTSCDWLSINGYQLGKFLEMGLPLYSNPMSRLHCLRLDGQV